MGQGQGLGILVSDQPRCLGSFAIILGRFQCIATVVTIVAHAIVCNCMQLYAIVLIANISQPQVDFPSFEDHF